MKKLLIILTLLSLYYVPINAKTIDMGEFKITYYCPCEECSEGYGRKTATQTCAESERTIAVDPDIIDLGSKVLIDGKEYVAEDVGGGVRGDHIDIFVDCHEETIDNGVKRKQVKVIH